MMKRIKSLWALLPVAVALIVASCSSEDATEPASGNDSGTKTIPVTITVGMDNATRATVGNDNSTLYFHTADKLAVLYSGDQIALLDNTSIAEGSSSATFQGNMKVPNAAESYGTVTVVLISQENVGVRENNSFQWNNDSHAICVANGNSTALNEAVKKYSYLTGTGPFNPAGQNNFTLTQHTAFLNFYVTFKDGTTANTNLSVTVTNNNSTIGSGSVTTTTEATNNDVVANFVVPVRAGTTLSSTTVTLGNKLPITLTSDAVLNGQSYRIEKTIYSGVQLWAGGPYWATMNVGASSPEEYGDYFAWGETTGYAENEAHYFNWTNYHWCNGGNKKLTKYCPSDKTTYWDATAAATTDPDNRLTLEKSDDAATANWGSDWRTPTLSEFRTLVNADETGRVTSEWISNYNNKGVAGVLFTGTQSGYTDKSLFFPAAGYRTNNEFNHKGDWGDYWSNTIFTNQPDNGMNMGFWHNNNNNITSTVINEYGSRYDGMPVRAVRETSLP